MDELILHEDARSGNCYKIRLTAAILGLSLRRHAYDILKGETRQEEFLSQVNPQGRIPVLQIGSNYLPESNAACFYLADGSTLIPEGRLARAEMLRWMFFEQYSHEPNIATLRFWSRYVGEADLLPEQRNQIPHKRRAGEEALGLMDTQLARSPWLAGEKLTLADIVLYAYTHVAEEGGFALQNYPHIGGWIGRVAQLPGYVAMD